MEITRKRGDTYPDVITVTNRKTKALVNLTGCSFKLTVDTLAEPPDASTKVYEIVGVITNPASGEVEFAPTPEQADLVGYYFYDIEMIDSFNAVTTISSGNYNYLQDITKN